MNFFVRFYRRILTRNKWTFNDEKATVNRVNLEYWSGKNIGDCLAPVIFRWMLERNHLENCCKGIKHLSGVGSLIGSRKYDSVIWGSGILTIGAIGHIHQWSKLIKYDVRAVRGPMTRAALMSAGYHVPEVYGDPGVLMPLIFSPQRVNKEHEVSIVYHHAQIKPTQIHIIDTRTEDYEGFITELLKSKRIISSSLHGIILAEAYGVPAIFLNEGMEDQLIKFIDWYHSTGRTEIKMARTLEEALAMEPMPLPDLTQMQEDIIRAFPVDIFSS